MIVLWQIFSKLGAWRLRNEQCVSPCEYAYVGILKDENNYVYRYCTSESSFVDMPLD